MAIGYRDGKGEKNKERKMKVVGVFLSRRETGNEREREKKERDI